MTPAVAGTRIVGSRTTEAGARTGNATAGRLGALERRDDMPAAVGRVVRAGGHGIEPRNGPFQRGDAHRVEDHATPLRAGGVVRFEGAVVIRLAAKVGRGRLDGGQGVRCVVRRLVARRASAVPSRDRGGTGEGGRSEGVKPAHGRTVARVNRWFQSPSFAGAILAPTGVAGRGSRQSGHVPSPLGPSPHPARPLKRRDNAGEAPSSPPALHETLARQPSDGTEHIEGGVRRLLASCGSRLHV